MWRSSISLRYNRLTISLVSVFFLFSVSPLFAQKHPIKYHHGLCQVYSAKEEGLNFKMFDFDMNRGAIKAQYFGTEGHKKYKSWRKNNRDRVLCYFAVGFAQDWNPANPPLGLCLEDGILLNQSLSREMDGLVGIDRYGRLNAWNIKSEKIGGRYNLLNSTSRVTFVSKSARDQASYFQTQLMYMHDGTAETGGLKYGKKASRRFLAICEDSQGNSHHIVMELVKAAFLNDAASKAIRVLEKKNYTVQYLLNQDTGSRNIMSAFDEKGTSIYSAPINISKATQLLVYYLD